MKPILALRHLKIENANAISGLTWGFPAISQFLGFSHALSRHLARAMGLRLGGCAVIAHRVDVQSQPLGNWGEQVFALTRNPLTKEGKTAPFNEEGRMHLEITLLIECDFKEAALPGDTRQEAIDALENWVGQKVMTMRVAGGTVTGLKQVKWWPMTENIEQRRLKFGLLPGSALIGRHSLLRDHHQQRLAEHPEAELLDSLLDFTTLRYYACRSEEGKVSWARRERIDSGYFVPLSVGYQGISSLYPAGEVANSRDRVTPFRFVENAYSLGQWLSPHRVDDIAQLFWRYHPQGERYLCESAWRDGESAESSDEDETFLDY